VVAGAGDIAAPVLLRLEIVGAGDIAAPVLLRLEIVGAGDIAAPVLLRLCRLGEGNAAALSDAERRRRKDGVAGDIGGAAGKEERLRGRRGVTAVHKGFSTTMRCHGPKCVQCAAIISRACGSPSFGANILEVAQLWK